MDFGERRVRKESKIRDNPDELSITDSDLPTDP